MEIQHGHERYWTTFVEDCEAGYAGFHLHRERSGKSAIIGQTIYWDATGRFFFGTFGDEEIPVEIIEAAIAEAREGIKTQ